MTTSHILFTLRANGTVERASSQEVLTAARAVLAHSVRRGALLQSPQQVGEYLAMRLGHLDYECFGLILVDGRHRVIDCVELFRGTIDGALVYPREVVKLALEKRAAAALAFHNHPSGVKEQSAADELITRKLFEALSTIEVRLLDHLVLAGSEVLSFAALGIPIYREDVTSSGAIDYELTCLHGAVRTRRGSLALYTVSEFQSAF